MLNLILLSHCLTLVSLKGPTTSAHFWHFWPLPTTSAHFWPLLTTSDHVCPLLLTSAHFWSLLTTSDHFWPPITTYDHLWPLMISSDHFWPLITTYDLFQLLCNALYYSSNTFQVPQWVTKWVADSLTLSTTRFESITISFNQTGRIQQNICINSPWVTV